jgi:hypothetical protein
MSDWRATLRRTVLLLWLWLADVTVDRSPMMVCPASHLPIAAANEAHGAPHLPHAGGAPYRKEDGSIVQGYLPHGFERSQLREPQPLLAKRGQVTALTTGMYHTSSPNFGARTTAQRLPARTTCPRCSADHACACADITPGTPSSRARKWINIMFVPESCPVGVSEESGRSGREIATQLRAAIIRRNPARARVVDPDGARAARPVEAYQLPRL